MSAVAGMVKTPHGDCRKHQRGPARTIVTSQPHARVRLSSLPPEVFQMILDKMSVRDLSIFSMVSKEINGQIRTYISTLTWWKRVINANLHHYTSHKQTFIFKYYTDLSLLFKRSTFLLPTMERLHFVFSKISQIPCFSMDQCLWSGCIGLSCCGVFFQTLTAGWDEMECHKVFKFLCELTNLQNKIEAVLTERPWLKWPEELQIRLYCRHVLLDHWPNRSDRQLWLNLLLRPWPLVSQARLLFILYGPSYLDVWYPHEVGCPPSALWNMANAINLLFSGTDRSNQSMLTILEELTVTPQEWHVENVAGLLLLCEGSLCYTVLASKALNGQLFEVSRLLVHVVLMCQNEHQISWVVKMVHQIYSLLRTAAEKLRFIQHLENMFTLVTMDMMQFSVIENHFGARRFLHSLQFFLNLTAHFHTQLLQMLLQYNTRDCG